MTNRDSTSQADLSQPGILIHIIFNKQSLIIFLQYLHLITQFKINQSII